MRKYNLIYLILGCSLAFVSCKPKQSNYKSTYEVAKEQEEKNNKNDYYIEEETYTYENTSNTSDNMNTSVKPEVINPVEKNDESNLKKYNVVVSSLGMYENAKALKAKLARKGYNPIIVQNPQGMYRVIIASTATKDQAINDRAQILAKFRQEGNDETLRKQYGISFNDWWILERTY